MAPSKLRKAIDAVKDQTSISLAKVGSSTSISDLEVAIVKATRHEEYPPDERHIREILNLTTYSRAFVNSCVRTIARRLNKTRNSVVALKALMLVQRLLAEGDVAYEQEIFFATRRGTRLLNLSDFRDTSGKSYAWDYSAFVRTYALYLDEQLELRMQGRRGKHVAYGCGNHAEEEEVGGGGGSPRSVAGKPAVQEMKTEILFTKVHRLMQLLDRFLACKPTGAARDHRVVNIALHPVVKESFQLYYDITQILGVLIDRFLDLEHPQMIRVHDIFSRAAKQYDELDAFYTWSKTVGIARNSEYPDVEKISQKKLDMMDEFIREKAADVNRMPEPESEPEPEEDMNAIKALPPPEEPVEENTEVAEKAEEVVEEPKEEPKKVQDEGDLLNLGEDVLTSQEHGDRLALALFDGAMPATSNGDGPAPWDAFRGSDWETALVQSASHLSYQRPSFTGNFDKLILDGMYQQGAIIQALAATGVMATGSESSIALGSAGRPSVLALPAPPTPDNGTTTSPVVTDPFAASLYIPPPSYVQMSDLEKKQRLLTEEQIMWQQYQRNGMRGQVNLAKAQQYPYQYNTGGYTGTY